MTDSGDIDKVFGPLNILRGDIWERSLAERLFDRLLDWFLAKGTEHGRRRERSVINYKTGRERIGLYGGE